jgi:predicted SAM-dependent methyltransferase
MMHEACEEWVRMAAARYVGRPAKVIELGGRNVNGSNRQHFSECEYISVDKREGPEVDLVVDAVRLRLGKPDFDVVVCTNVLEHEPRWRDVLTTAYECLRPDGVLIVTTVDERFPPHSGIDGCELQPDEHYEGVHMDELRDALGAAGFLVTDYRSTREGDAQAVAVKPEERAL